MSLADLPPGTQTWLIRLQCGHEFRSAWKPRLPDPWVSCSEGRCHAQRRVISVEPCEAPRAPAVPMVQGTLFDDVAAGAA